MTGRVSVPGQYFMPMAPPQSYPVAQPQQFAQPAVRQPQPQWNPGPGAVPAATLPPPTLPPTTLPAPTLPPPIVRAKAEDSPPAPAPLLTLATPPPAALLLPTPQELGVPAAPALDWEGLDARLKRLGGTGFQMTRLPQGGWRVAFVLPAGQQNRTQLIAATGTTGIEALEAALTAAEARR